MGEGRGGGLERSGSRPRILGIITEVCFKGTSCVMPSKISLLLI